MSVKILKYSFLAIAITSGLFLGVFMTTNFFGNNDSATSVHGNPVEPIEPVVTAPLPPEPPLTGTGSVYQPYDDDSPNIEFSTTGAFRLKDPNGNIVKIYTFTAFESKAITTWEFELTTTLKSDRLDLNTAFLTYEVRIYKGDATWGLLQTRSSFPPDSPCQETQLLTGNLAEALATLQDQGITFDQPTKVVFDCVVKHKTKHEAGFWAEEWLEAGAGCTVHVDAAGVCYLDEPVTTG